MKPAAGWTTPADIKDQLARHWTSGRLLAARVAAEPVYPLALKFRKPDVRALSDRFDEVRQWIRALDSGGKAALGFGYEIEWSEINHRQLGRNQFPAGVRIDSEQDALRLIGKRQEAERFSRLANLTLARFPGLADWLLRHPMRLMDHAEDWERILAILAWFRDHPRSGLYLRQLDIAGVDSKFIETRRGLLSDLLDLVLAPEAIDPAFIGARGFEQRHGLAVKPPLVRFRVLDPALAIDGLGDLTIPAADFARLETRAERVFITENEINGLAFPDIAGALVVFGLGYDVGRLAKADWLASRAVVYWGDIDTHGFAILDRLRARFGHARSLLMDRATLMAHRALWVREDDPLARPLDRLTPAETTLFDDLRHGVLGDRVRLEQERIAFGWVKAALALV